METKELTTDEWEAMQPQPKKRGQAKKTEAQGVREEVVALDAITVRPEIQLREKLSDEVVERYSAVYRAEPERMPPLDVYADPTFPLLLSAGFHRLAAARAAGLQTIRVQVHQGTIAEAMLAGALHNTRHGQPYRTARERRALILLLHEAGWSNAQIAPEVGVNLDTVYAAVRAAQVAQSLESFGIPKLSASHYDEIGQLSEESQWPLVARAAAEQQWPVARTKEVVRELRDPERSTESKAEILAGLERGLARHAEPQPEAGEPEAGGIPTPPEEDLESRAVSGASQTRSGPSLAAQATEQADGDAEAQDREEPQRTAGGPEVTIVREAERERRYRASEADPALAQELLAESRCALEDMWTAAGRLGETENYLVTLGNREDAQRLAGMGASLLWLADCLCRRLGIGLPIWGPVRAHLGVPGHATGEEDSA